MENETGRGTSQVEKQMADLEKASHVISDLIEQIGTRLTKVLLSQSVNEAKPDAPQKELVPLAGFIRNQAQFLITQANGLRDILSRIEL